MTKHSSGNMAMDDATLIKPRNLGYILRAIKTADEYLLEGEMVVGREVECAIAIESGHVSRYHAKINVMRSGVYIEDLHSTNGTFVNGKRIKGRVRLSVGDEVTFDEIAFRLTSSQSGNEAQTLLTPKIRDDDEDDTTREMPVQRVSNVQPFPARVRESAGAAEQPEPAAVRPPPALAAQPVAPPAPAPKAATPLPAYDDQDEAQEPPADEPTRMLSGAQIGRYIERNRSIQNDINPGSGPRLIIMTAPSRGKYYELASDTPGASWQIGRSPEAHIFLADKTISTDHARLTRTEEGYQLGATHARNGISVNGSAVDCVLLEHGDRIQVGGTELVFKTDCAEDITPSQDDQIEQSLNIRHALVGAFVIIVVLVTVLATSGS